LQRKSNYPRILEKIYKVTSEGVTKDGADAETWERVIALFRELNQRFHDVFGVDTRLKEFQVRKVVRGLEVSQDGHNRALA